MCKGAKICENPIDKYLLNGLNQNDTEVRKVSWKAIAAIQEYSKHLCSTYAFLSHLFTHSDIFIEHLLGVRWCVRHWRYHGEPIRYGPFFMEITV